MISDLKVFVWDILGYVIPGLYIMVLTDYFYNLEILSTLHSFSIVLVAAFSYLIGIFALGLSIVRDNILKYLDIEDYKIECHTTLFSSGIYKNALVYLHILYPRTISINNVMDARNQLMNLYPSIIETVYTFMFRSDVANNILTFNVFLGSLLIAKSIYFNNIDEPALLTMFYSFLLFLTYFPLRAVRKRFYFIAIKLPFTQILNEK